MFTRNLISLSLVPDGLLVFFLLGDVVTELSEIDDFADRRISRGRDFHQIETETLSLAEGVGQLHDAQLFAGGPHDYPDFASANPTVYTNLWLQIKSKLQTSEAGSEWRRRIFVLAKFRASKIRRSKHSGLVAAAKTATTGPRFCEQMGRWK